MTLTELLAEFQAITQDEKWELWNEAEVIRWLNEAQRDFCYKTFILIGSSSIALPTTGLLPLPADFIKLFRVEDASGRKLPSVTSDQLDAFLPDWKAASYVIATAKPAAFVYDPASGSQAIRIYPKPATASTASIFYAKTPAALVKTTKENSDLFEVYHPALLDFALFKAYLKDDESLEHPKAATYLDKYNSAVQLARLDSLLPPPSQQPQEANNAQG